MRSIIAALLALAVLVCGAASASAGSAPAGGRPDWRMGMVAHNGSPYELRYVTTHAYNIDTWHQAPDVPAPVGTIAPFGESVLIQWQTKPDRKGTWGRVIWDAYRDGVKRGQVTFAVRAECSSHSCGYLDPIFSDGTTTLPDVDLTWDSHGHPEYSTYVGHLWIRPKRAGMPTGPFSPEPLRELLCARRVGGEGVTIETLAVPCKRARAAVAAGTVARGRFATRGWQCTTRRGRGAVLRVTCAIGEKSFRFAGTPATFLRRAARKPS